MATIILTGGGTAGHVTPHLAILPYLKNDFDKIYYIGSENGIEKEIIKKANIPYYSVSCAKFNRSFDLNNLKIPFKLYSGYLKALKIIDDVKPDVIFSKGGYVAIPTVLAGKKRNITVISHESDYSLGLANKITSKHCKKVLTSFPDTVLSLKNGEFVGPPLRSSLFNTDKEKAIKTFGFNGNKPVLLVTGGSQGAFVINKSIRDALPDLLPKYDVIHICGKNNLSKEHNLKGYFQVEYMDNIENAFTVASVCISRAGSNTLFELLALEKPCVLIPLPKGTSRGDQILNAEYFQKLGVVNVLPQQVLTPQSLALAVNSTYANRFNITRNLKNKPIKDASREISNILASYIH